MPDRRLLLAAVTALCLLPALVASAADCPELYGAGRTAAWSETGILRQFPAGGLTVRWRAPLGPGYSGPAVAGGRVFVSDYQAREGGGAERVLCLDEQSGRLLWTYENPGAVYKGFAYNSGPRATPTVAAERVYVQGAGSDLYCLSVSDGTLLWQVNLRDRYQAKLPPWGFAASPLVYRDLVIAPAGGADSRLVALDKRTGRGVWRALPTPGQIDYSSPLIVHAGGTDQLVYWIPGEVASLDPLTGAVHWRLPFESDVCCALPASDGRRLFVSNFWKGSCLIALAPDKPAATMAWQLRGKSEAETLALHALMATPIIAGEYVYGICSRGELRCLKLATGERLWSTQEVTRERKRWANAFLVRNGDVYFLLNDRGELIIADLQPTGYRELSRTQLIKPTSGGAGSRELGKVNWVIPAYANGHVFIRNDEEIIRASLQQ